MIANFHIMKRSGRMNIIRKFTAVAVSVVLAAAFAAPVSASEQGEITVTVEQEYSASKVSVSKLTIGKIADQTYTGKALKPTLVVKYNGKTLKNGTDYTLTYKNNKNVGTATITLKGKGKYTGTKKLTFKIVPGTPSLNVKSDSGKITLSWAKAKGAGGYIIGYSTNGGSFKTLVTTSKTSWSTTKLDTAKNSYSFRVRSYKKVSGKKIYGAWSDIVKLDKSGTPQVTDPVKPSDNTGEFVPTNYKPSGNAGTVKYLGFYDITSDYKGKEQCRIFQSELYGGKIEYISIASGAAYYEKLGVLISADDSPDIVTKDAMLYPGNVSKNMFLPLDEVIDLKSSLWKDMKTLADSYAWNGKHYYVPHMITTSMALNYNKKTIAANGLPDPYELYRNGDWTWDTWRSMMEKFCAKSDDNIGFYTTSYGINSLILTTGTPIVGISGGKAVNNAMSPNVNRAMQFVDDLRFSGLSYDFQYGDWVSPQVFAKTSDKILFLVMEPEWTYIAATEEVQNQVGVENDIFDTLSDFAFVPMPRDSQADKYYQGYETFGFLIPMGARNVSGAADFINLFRDYETDKTVQENVKKSCVSPDTVVYSSGKYEGMRKWQMTWDEQQYDLWREMCDPANFTFVTENVNGFNSYLSDLAYDSLNATAMYGESWADISKGLSSAVDEVSAAYWW